MKEQEKLTKVINQEIWATIPEAAQEVISGIFSQYSRQIESQHQQIESQGQQLDSQRQQIEQLSKQLDNLKALINQNSQNSSRPPSTDPPSTPKYPPKKTPSGKSRGGQQGHQGYFRQPPPPDKITNYVEHRPVKCDHCQEKFLEDAPDAREVELQHTYELPAPTLIITQHRLHTLTCPKCGHSAHGKIEPEYGGSFGPRLHASVAYLRVRGISVGEIQNLLWQFYGLEIARSSISKICWRLSEALAKIHRQAEEMITQAEIVNTDETGWSEGGQNRYLWVHVSAKAVVYHITQKRTQEVMGELLGIKFFGLVGSDRLGIYNAIEPKRRQICLVHLLRNFIGLAQRGSKVGAWGERGQVLLEEVFSIWHEFKNAKIKRTTLQIKLSKVKAAFKELLDEGRRVPLKRVKHMSHNLKTNWEGLWTFSKVEGMEPTNNVSEQALRRPVLWRSLSFGSKSEWGCRFVERILTVASTCSKQKRPLIAYLEQIMLNYFKGVPPPPLFPLAN